MELLEKEELEMVRGRGFNWGLGLIIGSIATFLVGVLDGFFRPLSCHK